MTTRRPLLALPFLLAARPLLAAIPSWRRDIAELRIAGADPAAMAQHLGVPVRTLTGGTKIVAIRQALPDELRADLRRAMTLAA